VGSKKEDRHGYVKRFLHMHKNAGQNIQGKKVGSGQMGRCTSRGRLQKGNSKKKKKMSTLATLVEGQAGRGKKDVKLHKKG